MKHVIYIFSALCFLGCCCFPFFKERGRKVKIYDRLYVADSYFTKDGYIDFIPVKFLDTILVISINSFPDSLVQQKISQGISVYYYRFDTCFYLVETRLEALILQDQNGSTIYKEYVSPFEPISATNVGDYLMFSRKLYCRLEKDMKNIHVSVGDTCVGVSFYWNVPRRFRIE